ARFRRTVPQANIWRWNTRRKALLLSDTKALSSTFRNFSDEVFHLYTRLFHVVGISRSRSNAGTCTNPRANPSIDSVARRATTCCHQGHLSGGGLPIPPRKLRKVELSTARSGDALTMKVGLGRFDHTRISGIM